MKTETMHVLTEDGAIERLTLNREVVNVGPQVLAALSGNVIRSTKGVFAVNGLGPVDLSLPKDGAYYVSRPPYLPLKAPFAMREGLLVPEFTAEDPVLPLDWKLPGDMQLIFIVKMGNGCQIEKGQHWLLARDKEGRTYRLPLGNVYDDGRICLGDFPLNYNTAHEAMIAAWEQLRNSQWNSDLVQENDKHQDLFRYLPKNEGFIQQPPTADWRTLSIKINPPVLNFVQI